MSNSGIVRPPKIILSELFARIGINTSGATLFRRLSQISLGLTIVLIPFRYRIILQERPIPPIYGDYTDFLFFASDLFTLTTLLFWTLHLALTRKSIKTGPFFLTLPLAGLTGLGFLSTLFSLDAPLSLYNAIRVLLVGGLYLYVVNEVRSLKAIYLPVGIQLFIQAVVGITQSLRQSSIGLSALGEYRLDPDWQGVSIVASGDSRLLRAYGLTDHPNILGGCLAFGLMILMLWYLVTNSNGRILLSGLFALSGTALLLTFSRAAWLALSAGTALFLYILYRTNQTSSVRRLLLLVAAGLVVSLPFVWGNARQVGVRLNWGQSFQQVPQETQALGERQLLNRAANEIFVENA